MDRRVLGMKTEKPAGALVRTSSFQAVPIIHQQQPKPAVCALCLEPPLDLFRDPDLNIMTCKDCRGHLIMAIKGLSGSGGVGTGKTLSS
jgi:hypothetical protein